MEMDELVPLLHGQDVLVVLLLQLLFLLEAQFVQVDVDAEIDVRRFLAREMVVPVAE